MKKVRARLEHDLAAMVRRLRRTDLHGTSDDGGTGSGADTCFAGETDESVRNQERELRFDTRERLVVRINQITAALARLSRGEYGLCQECGQRIAPARLLALPEVAACVACQDRLERRGLRTAAPPSR